MQYTYFITRDGVPVSFTSTIWTYAEAEGWLLGVMYREAEKYPDAEWEVFSLVNRCAVCHMPMPVLMHSNNDDTCEDYEPLCYVCQHREWAWYHKHRVCYTNTCTGEDHTMHTATYSTARRLARNLHGLVPYTVQVFCGRHGWQEDKGWGCEECITDIAYREASVCLHSPTYVRPGWIDTLRCEGVVGFVYPIEPWDFLYEPEDFFIPPTMPNRVEGKCYYG